MGFPWNSPEQRARCEVGTALALFSLRVVATAAIVTSPVGSGPVLAVLEHPEDLGEALRGTPASIWQFDQALACEDPPLMRSGALFQCEWDSGGIPEAHPGPLQLCPPPALVGHGPTSIPCGYGPRARLEPDL